MPGVTCEQIDRAKEVDILDYILTHEPNNVKRIGKSHYLKDHDSLEISNGLWNWHSREIGGKNVVDYLIKVRGFEFVDAIRHLVGDDVSCNYVAPKSKPPPKRTAFALPPRNGDNDRVIAYLKERGISKPLIFDCIERGSLYESAVYHNCVFIGRDERGKARFAALRGTMGDFKRDADGSDKQFGFVLPPINGDSNTIATFESPIDALSYREMYPNFNGWSLSLGCTALAALTSFLERNKNVTNCIICTDNDAAGNMAAEKIAKLQGISATRLLPPSGKDWNDALKKATKPSLIGRLEAAKVTAAEINNLAERKQVGVTMCLLNITNALNASALSAATRKLKTVRTLTCVLFQRDRSSTPSNRSHTQ